MLELTSPFILWPVGIALGGLLFFEIAKRSCRVDSVPRGVEARSKAIGPERLAANPPLYEARVPGEANLRYPNEYLLRTRTAGPSHWPASTRPDARRQ